MDTKTIFGTMLSLTHMDIWAASPGDLDNLFIMFLSQDNAGAEESK